MINHDLDKYRTKDFGVVNSVKKICTRNQLLAENVCYTFCVAFIVQFIDKSMFY